jgi:hypothetical protein
MSENVRHRPLKLDPWAASSLLQKAIRRGETELAQRAGRLLYGYRGPAVFHRLCTIAVEDIGIADPDLLHEVARIGTDKALREILGSDAELIDNLCARMAGAVKDRSADYLISAATKLESAASELIALKHMPPEELVKVAADHGVPLIRRAVAALLACADNDAINAKLQPDRVEKLLDAFPVKLLPLHDAVLRLAHARSHPFCIMLPLIWSRWWHFGAQSKVVADELPGTEYLDGIPLYVFDFHTSAGKHAISRFAAENEELASLLTHWVPIGTHAEAAAIAAFYADAAPVARRLKWSCGSLLSYVGFLADMNGASCPRDGATPILECVRGNLEHLNRRRCAALGRNPR